MCNNGFMCCRSFSFLICVLDTFIDKGDLCCFCFFPNENKINKVWAVCLLFNSMMCKNPQNHKKRYIWMAEWLYADKLHFIYLIYSIYIWSPLISLFLTWIQTQLLLSVPTPYWDNSAIRLQVTLQTLNALCSFHVQASRINIHF